MDRLQATRVFVEVVERGSQSAAAEALDMSRAMVSRYLAELERWVGVRLLHRTTRRLSLTAAGEQALSQGREMLALAEAMQAVHLADEQVPSGRLRITCSQSLAQAWLARELSAFLAQHRQVSVELLVSNQAMNLVEQRIDLALRITNQLDPNLIARPLGQCRSVVCASPDYLRIHGTPRQPDDLGRHNCLGYSLFGRSLWTFLHDEEPCAVAVAGNLSANESQVLLEAALAGAGISLQPRYSVIQHLQEGSLVALLPGHEPQPMGIHAVYGSRRQMPLAQRLLLEHLAARLNADAGWQG